MTWRPWLGGGLLGMAGMVGLAMCAAPDEPEPVALPLIGGTVVASGATLGAAAGEVDRVPVPVPVPGTPSASPSYAITPVPTAKPKPQPVPTAKPAARAYYANCTAAKDAGAAPLHRGEAGYRSALDRDGDGTACE